MRKTSQHSQSHPGFSLTELLVVMAIIAAITTATLPMLSGIVRGSRISQALQHIGGTMENARQTAIAQNTFVWVAFSEVDPNDKDSSPSIAIFLSKTGLDPLDWNSAPTDIGSQPDLQFVDKPLQLSGVQIQDSQTLETVNWSIPQAGKNRTYSKAIQFTPTGDARVKNMKPTISFAVVPMRGDSLNTATVTTKTITGKTTVSRDH